ncbi:MAG: dihydroorotate dehydrogenase-like protein [Bacteroidales bacterium]|jgi:dihydroorotate dehydrogenase (fumarate)|nr:dihydroorotate dehydrogenase-like protein [Bacteroidales bacterium]MCU0407613.1 dihydroorotate dehydrogenase-like protein [Bacteroidales bacterium]
MNKLETSYLGLKINSPLIVSSSRLTASLEGLQEAEKAGAGAAVLKSLFEEQIHHEISAAPQGSSYPEADDYMAYYIEKNAVSEYLQLIRDAKSKLKIPVIASINCYSSRGWTDFARSIEGAGADAIEINLFFLPHSRKQSGADSEKMYFEIIENLAGTIKIPISIKIGFRFSNILYMIDQFYMRGVKGVVMFNRFFEPDIDTERGEIVPAGIFSDASERRYVLRWVAMASAQDIAIDISATTGVHSGTDAIRYLLAGAASVQACSVLYEKGISYIKTMNDEIEAWMSSKGYGSIAEFRGSLNWRNITKPEMYERTQFMKYFSSAD